MSIEYEKSQLIIDRILYWQNSFHESDDIDFRAFCMKNAEALEGEINVKPGFKPIRESSNGE